MKNQIVFLLLSLFAFSCSDDAPVTFQEEIIGEWQVNSFVINSCPDVSNNLPLTLSDDDGCLDFMGDRTCMSITIFDNGVAEIRDGESMDLDAVENMTYEVDDVNNTFDLCQEEDCITFSLRDGALYNDMDEDGCICTLGFKKS